MARGTEIPVGRGRVIIDPAFRNIAGRGKYIILRLKTRQGPCNDAGCQPIMYASLEIAEIPDNNLRIFAGEGYFLALDQEIFSAIDRNRQTAFLKKVFPGRYSVRGIYF